MTLDTKLHADIAAASGLRTSCATKSLSSAEVTRNKQEESWKGRSGALRKHTTSDSDYENDMVMKYVPLSFRAACFALSTTS
mmetsp:Transcript_3909/g.9474  ORF Transcript_3909/g.9474 Transcript_3909/m.9474 type:complete len:82 (+) Transcript_3909:3073-3318(+)